MFRAFFQWLCSWFRGNAPYHPQERLVYKFFNGEREVWADPMVLWTRLTAVGQALDAALKVAKSPSKGAAESRKEAAKMVREIFGIKPLEDGLDARGTLTDDECFAEGAKLLHWMDNLKKNSSPSPTVSLPTADSPASSSPGGSTTRNFSVSGSTPNDSSTESPEPLLSEKPSPMAASSQD